MRCSTLILRKELATCQQLTDKKNHMALERGALYRAHEREWKEQCVSRCIEKWLIAWKLQNIRILSNLWVSESWSSYFNKMPPKTCVMSCYSLRISKPRVFSTLGIPQNVRQFKNKEYSWRNNLSVNMK